MSGVLLDKNSQNYVRSKFTLLRTTDELAALLNYIENKYSSSETPPLKKIDSKHLFFLAQSKNRRYIEFKIPKKSGEVRIISSPDPVLQRVQRLINYLLQIIFEPSAHYCSNGFLNGRGIVRNAKPHVNKNYVLNVDIKNYFPSIQFRRIKTVLGLSPFNFIREREHLGFLIANLCSLNNSLPQGAPTSPILSNIVTQKLDRKLNKLCLKRKIKYSRYADDLSFSSNKNILGDDFVIEVSRIVLEERFEIKPQKTRLKTDMDRQSVTGLVVNEKINVKREFLQKTRAMINNWEKGGLIFAKKKFKNHQPKYNKDNDFINTLHGYISFIGHVKGRDNAVFMKLEQKVSLLKNQIDYNFIDDIRVKNRLENDNKKMERILNDNIHDDNNKFISFCTSGFHQIENLLNYFYWKRFPDFDDLLKYLLAENPRFKERHKEFMFAKRNIPRIGKLDISVLVYIFEKEYFISKGKYYDRRISKLRAIRNDDSHRCQVNELNNEAIKADYEKLQLKIQAFKTKKGRYPVLQGDENEVDFNYKLIEFLEAKNFNFTRKIVSEVAMIVKDYFK